MTPQEIEDGKFQRAYQEVLQSFVEFIGHNTDLMGLCGENGSFVGIGHHYENANELAKKISVATKLIRPLARDRKQNALVDFIEKTDTMMCWMMDIYKLYLADHNLRENG